MQLLSVGYNRSDILETGVRPMQKTYTWCMETHQELGESFVSCMVSDNGVFRDKIYRGNFNPSYISLSVSRAHLVISKSVVVAISDGLCILQSCILMLLKKKCSCRITVDSRMYHT